jgi:hypothetical protein
VVDVPYLNAMEHDRRYPPSNHLIDQLAEIVGIPADLLYFHAKRLPGDIRRNVDKAGRLGIARCGLRASRQYVAGGSTVPLPSISWSRSCFPENDGVNNSGANRASVTPPPRGLAPRSRR